ncbi:low molecular mass 30 kDa lipoprotein 21G1 [Manduca sexta]|uniref:Peptidoglycan recognition protein n=1 Tax=Manduca sexta TaxID=7130 RepID=A0A921ZIW8_MANSE|nr:low molecular mass 30 kDa lipoprotein 21G1 [Manduca sexta]KAG6458848.1 hypothetical protein O3G_MSEX011090 [Manduca sexta]KAG6458849.1 hypothetical protein O3G_MSEX011090 [Manduca sexta]
MWWHSCVLFLFLKWSLINADCDVIDKKEWNGVNPHCAVYVPRPVNLVIIVHTDTPWCSTTEQCKTSIKKIQTDTINSNKFYDVGYSFMIGGDGKVYEGVGWIHVGFHTIGYDRSAIGIAFVGNYNKDAPTAQQMEALNGLLACGVKLGHLTPDYRIITHRQLILSDSPGKSLYNEIRKRPQWIENIDKISEARSLIITGYAVELGFYDTKTGLLNISGIDNRIYEAVGNRDYNNAVDLSMILEKFGTDKELTDVVNKLLYDRVSTTLEYAYKLWDYGGQKIVLKHFPVEFQMILNGESFQIENTMDTQALKTDASLDNDGDRNIWGDSRERSTNRMKWKMFPIWEENKLYFKIFNTGHQMYMKMGVKEDDIGDRNVYASSSSDTYRHQWYLHPLKHNNEVLFLIYNREYGHVLKLARAVDDLGDRLLWGQKESSGDPDILGWRIFH